MFNKLILNTRILQYRAIYKKKIYILHDIKWNCLAYPLATIVSNHRRVVDNIKDCSERITVLVPDESKRVEYLIDCITCADNTLQATIGLIRANNNRMRTNFDLTSSSLIEVDPYRRSQRPPSSTSDTISGINFSCRLRLLQC